MISPSSEQSVEPYLALAQSLTEPQLMQILEAIATGHSADLQTACEIQLQYGMAAKAKAMTDSQKQIQALQAELLTERTRRQAAEQDAVLWKQKFVKSINYLRRHM